MTKEIKELKEIMKNRALNIETTAHYIGCSSMSVYRWLNKGWIPSQLSRRKIQEGLQRIDEAFPESVYSLAVRERNLYQKIKGRITDAEKAELSDIHFSEDGEKGYIKKLQELVRKYQLNKAQMQMFKSRDDSKR